MRGGIPKVYIVIVTWNDYDDLFECLESLREVPYPNYKITVVNAEPQTEKVDLLIRKFGRYVVLLQTKFNLGAPGNRNIGIRYALANGADYVLLLDSDTVLEPKSLMRLVEIGESDSKIGAVQPKVCLYEERDKVDQSEVPYYNLWSQLVPELYRIRRTWFREQGEPFAIEPIHSISAGASLVKRETFEAIGLQDPLFFYGCEDLDFSFRAIKAGFRLLFVPSAVVYHKRRSTSKSRGVSGPFHTYHIAKGRLILARKTLSPPSRLIYYTILFVVLVPRAILVNLKNPKNILAYLRGVRDGLATRIAYHHGYSQ